MNIRIILVLIIMSLCLADLCLTYFYVNKYKKWQPNKPYKLIEMNPLLRFSWEKLGLHIGMIVAGVVILALNYIVSREAHWVIVLLLLGFFIWAIYNHLNNIGLLFKLIEKYPSGHLSEKTFGTVIGNN